MACAHVGFEQKHIVVGFHGAQLCHHHVRFSCYTATQTQQ
jgi:hypothetical protein